MKNEEEAGKMFVGGLSYDTTKEKLQAYFCRFGEIIDCVIMKHNETGQSRGFGFVTFKDQDCVTLVLSSSPHELDNRTIDPKACTPKGAQRSKKDKNSPKIFLGGLPTNCTEFELQDFFKRYGKVSEIIIMYDHEKKVSRGFGFLSFESEDSVEQVCAEHYVTINGKQVECKAAEPKENSKSARAARAAATGVQPDIEQQWPLNWSGWSQQQQPQYMPQAQASYPGWNSSNYGYGNQQYNQQQAQAQQSPTAAVPYQSFGGYSTYSNYPSNNGSSYCSPPPPPPPPPQHAQSSPTATLGTNYAQKNTSYGPMSANSGNYAYSQPEGGSTHGGSQGYHPYRH